MKAQIAVVVGAVLLLVAVSASAQDAVVRRELAGSGALRVGLNGGNALTQAVGRELAAELARRVGVMATFTVYPTPGAVIDASASWDIAFIAADPDRAATVSFTAPYVLLDATYIVKADSPIARVADADRPGLKVAAGATTAYALYLRRELKQAQLVSPPNAEALKGVLSGEIAGLAGLRFDLMQTAARTPGVRVIPDNITRAQQAVAVPKANQAALTYVEAFLREMKRSGFIAAAIARTGLPGATPAE
jgi:polar amino acid transport system substrate-binding protein